MLEVGEVSPDLLNAFLLLIMHSLPAVIPSRRDILLVPIAVELLNILPAYAEELNVIVNSVIVQLLPVPDLPANRLEFLGAQCFNRVYEEQTSSCSKGGPRVQAQDIREELTARERGSCGLPPIPSLLIPDDEERKTLIRLSNHTDFPADASEYPVWGVL